ncbi:hypothetical protein NX014_11770 [Vibrio vulnificus]|nr:MULTISPECIES: hypothetical protein [Vibrio]EHY1013368.1 hypothetical protein [Vibrio vulnificus]EHY1120946.1 hypothetical protein [Vibrio vulnificus]EHY1123564.1 hypothetical protein [Vibrio vulnificus]EID4338502.1 hypothetical protein [Vibrio vulnificus]EIU7744817.1 hypothetical protein [Vibrio vulnificus]
MTEMNNPNTLNPDLELRVMLCAYTAQGTIVGRRELGKGRKRLSLRE